MNRHSIAVIGATLLALSAMVCTVGGLSIANSSYYRMRLHGYLSDPSALLDAGLALKMVLVVLTSMVLAGIVLLMAGLSGGDETRSG